MGGVLRCLLVCFLAAAWPWTGRPAAPVLGGGALRALVAAQAVPGPLAPDPVPLVGHAAHAVHVQHAHHAPQEQPAQQALPPHCQHLEAPADAAGTPDPTDASPAPSAHKCSACDACAGATPLPAQALRFEPPQARPVRYQRLAQGALRFITDGPDRPPRSRRS